MVFIETSYFLFNYRIFTSIVYTIKRENFYSLILPDLLQQTFFNSFESIIKLSMGC